MESRLRRGIIIRLFVNEQAILEQAIFGGKSLLRRQNYCIGKQLQRAGKSLVIVAQTLCFS